MVIPEYGNERDKIPRIIWNPKVHYHIHKSSPPILILSHVYPFYAPTSHFLRINFIITLPSTPGFPSGLFPSSFPTKTLYGPPLFAIFATCPAHLFRLDLITRILFGYEYRSLNSSLCSLLHSPNTSSLLGPNIFLSTLFSNTLSYVSPSMWAMKFQTHTNNRLNYTSVYLNLYTFG